MTDIETQHTSFDTMGLKDPLLKRILAYGFKEPSLIQQKVIVPMCTGNDIIVESYSGQKTTLTIGLLQQLNFSKDAYCQAIILCPTKLLTEETNTIVNNIGDTIGVKTLCRGNKKQIETDLEVLKKGVHVMIGTPICILDLLKCNAIDTKKIKICIIVETEYMFDRGFSDSIDYIINNVLSNKVQLCFFLKSAYKCDIEIILKITSRISKRKHDLSYLYILESMEYDYDSYKKKHPYMLDYYYDDNYDAYLSYLYSLEIMKDNYINKRYPIHIVVEKEKVNEIKDLKDITSNNIFHFSPIQNIVMKKKKEEVYDVKDVKLICPTCNII